MGVDEDDFVIAPDRHRRPWWIAAAIAVAVVVLLAGTVWALSRRSHDQRTASKPPAIEPAQVTTPSAPVEATTSPAATASPEAVEPTITAGESKAPTTPGDGVGHARTPYLAFRLNGMVYLAREGGVRAVPLTRTDGVFALSPDARSLAFVDPAGGLLKILDLSHQTTTTVGPARQVTPRWAPDSTWVLAVRDAPSATEVIRVERSKGTVSVLGPGAAGAVSPDGKTVGLVPVPTGQATDALMMLKDGRYWKRLRAPAAILDAALGAGTAYVATTGDTAAAEGVWALPFGGGSRLVSDTSSEGESGDFGMLALSDNGGYLAYARVGDDGRSRASIVRLPDGRPVDISLRRDVYPLGWATDSAGLYAIEGNSWQGEATALVRISADGKTETEVVSGADR